MRIAERVKTVPEVVMVLSQEEHDGLVQQLKVLAQAGLVNLGEGGEVGGVAEVTVKTSRGVSVSLPVAIPSPPAQPSPAPVAAASAAPA